MNILFRPSHATNASLLIPTRVVQMPLQPESNPRRLMLEPRREMLVGKHP